MGTITYQIPVAGQLNSTEDAKVATALQTLLTLANGNVDTNNLSASAAIVAGQLAGAVGQSAGVNQAGQTVKGTVSIAGSESRTNVAYGTLATPDQVAGIVLPTNGLIRVWYQANWQESVHGAGRAAIFIGANQLQVVGAATPVTQAAATNSGSSVLTTSVFSSTFGLVSTTADVGASGPVTTGCVVGGVAADFGLAMELGAGIVTAPAAVGGPCDIFAAAGTYTVSVQFKSSSGSVTASNRKLWVQALSFG